MREFVLSVFLVCALASPAAAAYSPLENLRDLGVSVALPATVPPGFRLERVLTPKAWGGPAFGPTYVALYRGPGNAGFAIESSASDLGEVGAWDEHPVAKLRPRFFPRSGNVGLYWRGPRQNVARGWVSDWIEGPEQFYRLIGPSHVRNDYGDVWSATRELDQAWAVKVLDSVRILGARAVARPSGADKPRPFLTDFEQDNQWKDIRTVPIR